MRSNHGAASKPPLQEAFIKASIIRHHDHFDHHSVGVGDKDNLKFGQVYFHHFSTSRLRSALIVYTYNSLFVVFLLLPCSICLSDLQYFSSLLDCGRPALIYLLLLHFHRSLHFTFPTHSIFQQYHSSTSALFCRFLHFLSLIIS